MPTYWKQPESVEALQWHPEMGILRGTQGFGCAYCFPNVCVSSAHHEQGPRPHHLLLQTYKGQEVVFATDWIVTFSDRRQACYNNADFRRLFSEQELVGQPRAAPAPEAAAAASPPQPQLQQADALVELFRGMTLPD